MSRTAGTLCWTLARARARLDDATFAAAWEQGRKLAADEAVALALDSLE